MCSPRRPHAAALPTLRGEDLHLGPWPESEAVADAAAVARLHADPRTMRYWNSTAWASDDQPRAEAFLDDVEAGARGGTLLRFAARRPGSSALVGWVTLFRIEPPRPRTEIGYLLDPALWGQGLGRRMVALALGHAIDALGAQRIEAEVETGNFASCRLLESLGFEREGPILQRWRTANQAQAMALYVLPARHASH